MPDTPTAPTSAAVDTIPEGHVLAIGTVRRLRSFAVAGWPTLPISRLTGIPEDELARIRSGRHGAQLDPRTVPSFVADEVSDAYDLVSSLDPARYLPDTDKAREAITEIRRVAARNRWVHTPFMWEGLDMDDPKVTTASGVKLSNVPTRQPRRVTCTELLELLDAHTYPALRDAWAGTPMVERRRAVLAFVDRGFTTAQIAELVDMYPRSVQRIRSAAQAEQQLVSA